MRRWSSLLKHIELALGRLGHVHLTVTGAMRDWLIANGKIPAEAIHVLYDRPTHNFCHLTLPDKHAFLSRLFEEQIDDEAFVKESPSTRMDEVSGQVIQRPDKERDRAIVVTSSSFTEDEDFDLLWQAVCQCELLLAKGGPKRTSLFPTILLFITGKGSKRSHYEDLFRSQHLHFFRVHFCWLPAQDYPRLLASADLGICLHTSSSGLDLPMKAIDMLGCGLPILAYKYPCIAKELIEEEDNGLLFEDAEDLTQQLLDLFHAFPKGAKMLSSIAANLQMKPLPSWRGHWNKIVLKGILQPDV